MNNTATKDLMILKSLRIEHNYCLSTLNEIQRDAIIMERLSPRIFDMYGLCGTSITVKSTPFPVDAYVVPMTEGQNGTGPVPVAKNILTPTEKLRMALEMAESLADLHGFRGGAIVHSDIQLGQWLRDSPGCKLVLGDFNLAKILSFDQHGGTYCKYTKGRGHGNVSVTTRRVLMLCTSCLSLLQTS